MLHIGCHLSTTKGYYNMVKTALSIDADTFAFFTRNPRGGNVKETDLKDMEDARESLKKNGFYPLVAHAPYTYNLCSEKEDIRDFSLRAMKEDLEKLEMLPGNYYNFHPGSHRGQGIARGIDLISAGLESILPYAKGTVVLLETMAGKGTEVGSDFRELRSIIDNTSYKDRIGVCFDTCHVYDGGYDIKDHLKEVLDEFDKIIGVEMIRAVHINDTKNPFSSHKDRHERIGFGTLGADTFKNIVRAPVLKDIPFILETPNDLEGYKKEIGLLRGFC